MSDAITTIEQLREWHTGHKETVAMQQEQARQAERERESAAISEGVHLIPSLLPLRVRNLLGITLANPKVVGKRVEWETLAHRHGILITGKAFIYPVTVATISGAFMANTLYFEFDLRNRFTIEPADQLEDVVLDRADLWLNFDATLLIAAREMYENVLKQVLQTVTHESSHAELLASLPRTTNAKWVEVASDRIFQAIKQAKEKQAHKKAEDDGRKALADLQEKVWRPTVLYDIACLATPRSDPMNEMPHLLCPTHEPHNGWWVNITRNGEWEAVYYTGPYLARQVRMDTAPQWLDYDGGPGVRLRTIEHEFGPVHDSIVYPPDVPMYPPEAWE